MQFENMQKMNQKLLDLFLRSYEQQQHALDAIEGMVRQGLHPKEVAKVVIHAIDNPKPKLRYLVGKDAEEFIEASRKLPEQELFQTVSRNISEKRG